MGRRHHQRKAKKKKINQKEVKPSLGKGKRGGSGNHPPKKYRRIVDTTWGEPHQLP